MPISDSVSASELRQWILANSTCRIRECREMGKPVEGLEDRAFGFHEGMMAVYDHILYDCMTDGGRDNAE